MMTQSQLEDFVLSSPDFDNHEEVLLAVDAETGLQALIAVHNRFRGPGTGGTRLWRYSRMEDAVTDVLRLSLGMTYKNAMAELPFGGGKAVIIAPEKLRLGREALMEGFGRAVDSLEGRYCTAEDVGTSCEDMAVVGRATKHIFGLRDTSGDPSPHTARGVLFGIEEGVRQALYTDSLKGVRVLVQGVGHVGYHLCNLLREKGADVVVSDVNAEALMRCEQEFGVEVVSPDRIFEEPMDVYAPCALGATVSEQTLAEMKCRVIAGAANNQLAEENVAVCLQQKGILYLPDYVINAGGIINIACEVSQAYDAEVAAQQVEGIRARTREILARAKAEGKTTCAVAGEMARERYEPGEVSQVRVRDLARVGAEF